MVKLLLPTSAAGLAWIALVSVVFGISITLSCSSMFFSSSLQGYFLDKQEEITREGKVIPSPIRDFSQDAYQEGYLRGQREAYWDAGNHLTRRGTVALGIAQGLLYGLLVGLFFYVLGNRRKASAPRIP
jgi:ABC-type uncharacterized transport system permease subunit